MEIGTPANPFPGLRPFEFDESHLFFGRDGQSEQLIGKLGRARFLAVVGTSGSGKSSLVRAGLLPTLLGGFMTSAGSDWRIAIMRPGNDPVRHLAQALNARDVFGSDIEENAAIQTAIAQATLRRGSLGLVDSVRQAAMPENENLLVVVDQFEEIFRFARVSEGETYHNDAAAFVKLILEASRQREIPIYVVLTMRSDYLGDCSQFWDLPESINESQYLIPRLTRDQLREAITGPAAVGLGKITPRLVNRLLNDVGDDQDQLPILQHALMRSWDEWKLRRHDHQPQNNDDALDLCCYQFIGGMTEALSRHAQEAFDELPDERSREVAGCLFKCLTEKGPDNREIRRPTPLAEICAVVDATEAEAIVVIETFRKTGRSFLMPPAGVTLNSSSLIDISHESLIRVWKRLGQWVAEEARSARQYQRLAETAMLRDKGEAGLWRDPDLQLALNWRDQNKPNAAWARRYHPGLSSVLAGLDANQKQLELEKAFSRALAFLSDSERHRGASVIRRRMAIAALLLLSLFAITAAVFALKQKKVAEERTHEAIERNNTVTRLLYASDMAVAQKEFDDNNRVRGYELLNGYLPVAGDQRDDLRDFDWYYLWRMNHHESASLRGHASAVRSVAFLSDGKSLASIGADNTIKLWSVSKGEPIGAIQPPGKPDSSDLWDLSSVALSPDGKTMAWLNGTVEILDVSTGKVLKTLDEEDPIVKNSVTFSPDGRTAAVGGADKVITLWDLNTGKQHLLLGHGYSLHAMSFSPDGKLLASSSADPTVKVWEVSTGKLLKTLPHREETHINSLAFSPDGKTLACGDGDQSIQLWDLRVGKAVNTLRGHHNSMSLSFSPDGKTLASGSDDKTIKLWEVSAGKLINTLLGHEDYVTSVTFSPDGKTLASGSWDMTVKFWDLNAVKAPNTIEVSEEYQVSSVAFSPEGILASASGNQIRLWESSTGRLLNTILGQTDTVRSVAFSHDGKMLASASDDKTIRLWDVNTANLLGTLKVHTIMDLSEAFSPDWKTLVSGSQDRRAIKLSDVGTGSPLRTLDGHEDFVLSVSFSPDGTILASCSADKTIKLWEVGTGKQLNTIVEHAGDVRTLAFSPDRKALAGFGGMADTTVRLWEVSTGKLLNTLAGHGSPVRTVAFSPDGKSLASGGSDNTIRLWDVSTGKPLNTLAGKGGQINSLVFSPDGKTLAVGSSDTSIMLVRAATDQDVARQRSK